MPIGKIGALEMTDEELDEVWQKYGKLERGRKLRKLINLRRN